VSEGNADQGRFRLRDRETARGARRPEQPKVTSTAAKRPWSGSLQTPPTSVPAPAPFMFNYSRSEASTLCWPNSELPGRRSTDKVEDYGDLGRFGWAGPTRRATDSSMGAALTRQK